MAMLATLVAGLVSATPPHTDATRTPVGGAPIIGGYGAFKYQYMPGLLQFPAGAEARVHCIALLIINAGAREPASPAPAPADGPR